MQKYNWFGQVLNIIRIEQYLVYKVTIYNGTKWQVGGGKTNNLKISHHAWKHPTPGSWKNPPLSEIFTSPSLKKIPPAQKWRHLPPSPPWLDAPVNVELFNNSQTSS